MTIKVKHILLVILIVIVATILYNVLKKPINEMLEQKKYEKQIIDFFNLESLKDMSKGTIEEYEYYKNYYNEPDIDISPLIESYIKQIETNEKNEYSVGGLEVPLTSNIRREISASDYTYVTFAYYGENRTASISELEKILIHKSDDKYKDWWIPKDSPSIIDLPYNFYLKYEPSDFKLLDKVKKVTKCTFIDPVTEYSYNGRKRIKTEYIDKNDNKQYINGIIYLSNDDNNNTGAFLIGLYYTESHNAKIELRNHYTDKIREEVIRLDYDNDAGWSWDWEREDCKAIVDKFR